MRNPVSTFSVLRRLLAVVVIASWSFTLFAGVPAPHIVGEDVVCVNAEYTYTTFYAPWFTWEWEVSPGGVITSVNGNTITVKWIGPKNSSQYVIVKETNSIDEIGTDTLNALIKNTDLACENLVIVAVDENGEALITPEILLEGYYNTYQGFLVSVSNPAGAIYDDLLSCELIGKILTGKVTDLCTGNSCSSSIKLKDKMPPTFDCPGDPVEIPCNTDIDNYPHPPVSDNCTIDPVVNLTGFQIDNSDICSGVQVTKTWYAADEYGNESTCVQTLFINPESEVVFPDDIIWDCKDYAAHPNITDPAPLTNVPSTTGSGIPDGTGGSFCQYSYLSQDDTLYTCGNNFKIVRTWSVLNWCTGEIILKDNYGNDNQQVIRVHDTTPPEMTVPTIVLNATVPGAYPFQCTSFGLLPPPAYSDNCNNVIIRIFTDFGEAEYVNGVDGKAGGYVPNPGFKIGKHNVLYKAIDDCGNFTEISVEITVTDTQVPTAICDEHTDVNLTALGTAEVFASTFDDGSHDNCCIDRFEAKRMGQSDSYFSPSLFFDCDDDEVTVVVRVYDCFGNYNDCMVTAFVKDKIVPTCIAPIFKVIPCTDVPATITQEWLNQYGEASYYDNCSATVVELPWEVNINSCGEGHLYRSWVVVDPAGNIAANCEQSIFVVTESEWKIQFPGNWYGSCSDAIDIDTLKVINPGCDMWAISHKDQVFVMANDSACYKIVRTWKAVNWCTYDPNAEPIKLPTNPNGLSITDGSYDNYGQYEYQQIILVYNDTPPVVSYPFANEFCSTDSNCELGDVFIPLQIEGECSNLFEIVYHLDLNNDLTYDLNGTGYFEGQLPLGNHRIVYLVQDGCSNQSQITILFSVIDCKKPTPYCENGLVVELMSTGMVPVCADVFDAGSFDNCPGDLIFSFSPDVTDTCRIFTCVDILDEFPVQIWVTDAQGNQDYCETFIIIQDNFFSCDTGIPLEGKVQTEVPKAVEGVNIQLSGAGNSAGFMTDADGNYSLSGLIAGGDYTVVPVKDDQPLNGVTTFDLVLISRHILGIQALDSPYKMIAADANNSNSITTYDLVEIRKLILKATEEFQNNTSWRFVDKNYIFPNPSNPWEEAFPEVININNLVPPATANNFVAIKIGDVNASAVTNSNFTGAIGHRSADLLMFETEKQDWQQGETVRIDFLAKDFNSVYGFQFTIDFDQIRLDFQNVVPTALTNNDNFGTTLTQMGAITVSWFDNKPVTLDNGEAIISLEFKVKSACKANNSFGISSRFTNAEAYIGEDMEIWDIGLDFLTVSATGELAVQGFDLYQNVPNPFNNETVIGFQLPEAMQATLTIIDASGKTLKVISGKYPAGYNEILVNSSELPAMGMLYYRLETPVSAATRVMTLLRK